MMEELVKMYDEGAITGYELMLQCLHMVDPSDPALVLSHLPPEILQAMMEYARRYDPSRMRSVSGLPPAPDQVRSTQSWIEEYWRKQEEPKEEV